jgi:WNK lysine deficient protein kinase
VGKCLETVSKRLPAEELLLDPFLASDEGGLLPIPCPKPISNRTVVESPPSVSDPTRSTDMTITGTLDPEEDTIFIKVQISDKDGMSKPFSYMCTWCLMRTIQNLFGHVGFSQLLV